ncbi:hypothetical protein AB1Y20_011370 [Prymnesium parvum]|uniref:Selenoprotein O n=1 Tax=Prymnesium parvum TaxID=97485 RepID=A0AB34IQE4_PRYPA
MLPGVVTRRRSRAAAAVTAASVQRSLFSENTDSSGRHASPVLSAVSEAPVVRGSLVPSYDVQNHDEWMPRTSGDDADDAVDREYFAVLMDAVQVCPFEGLRALGSGSSALVPLWGYEDEVWSPVAPRDEGADDFADREYLAHLTAAIQQSQEEERQERVRALMRQQASEESLPLLQRDCVICTDALSEDMRDDHRDWISRWPAV